MISSDPYFPVPTIRRDENSLPPITSEVSMPVLLLPCSATHRSNHLDAIPVLEPDGLELVPARDLTVHGDGGELAFHAERGEQALDAEAVRHLHHLAVDRDLHRPSVARASQWPKNKTTAPTKAGAAVSAAVFPSLGLSRSGSRGPGPHPVLRNPPPTTTIGVYHRPLPYDGHGLDFDEHALDGEPTDLDQCAGRFVGPEVLLADLVDLGPVVHVGEIDGHLDDVIERPASRSQRELHVVENPPRLSHDVASANQPAGRIEATLAGDVDRVAGANGVRVMADGLAQSLSANQRVGGHDFLRCCRVSGRSLR